MPHKFNAARRHKFEKKRYRVTNWASYSESLRRRGDLTVWFDADALDLWVAPRGLFRLSIKSYAKGLGPVFRSLSNSHLDRRICIA